jgi:hypothetical protein
MRISEILCESDEQELARLVKSRNPNYVFKVGNEDTWAINSQLTPYVIVSPDTIKIIMQSSPDEREKMLFDSFYGLFPHEYDEAEVTIALCRGKVDQVLKKYPKYKIHPRFYERLKDVYLNDNEIYLSFNENPSIHDNHWIGGEAHEIIISDNPSSYYKFIGM